MLPYVRGEVPGEPGALRGLAGGRRHRRMLAGGGNAERLGRKMQTKEVILYSQPG